MSEYSDAFEARQRGVIEQAQVSGAVPGARSSGLDHFWSREAGGPITSDTLRVFTHRHLEPPVPSRERTHFSGGVNLSAIERNRAELDRYELERLKVYVYDGGLHCCPSAWETLRDACRKAGKRVVRC